MWRVNRWKLNNYTILGQQLQIHDNSESLVTNCNANELNQDSYRLLDMKRLNKIKSNDTVLDLGLNIGMTAVMVAKLFPGVRIIGVEAVPSNCAAALANIYLNQVTDSVTVLCAPLGSDVTSEINIRYSHTNPGSSTGSSEFFAKGSDDTKGHQDFAVWPITVDEIMQEFGLHNAHVPFIKLDCEGCEYDIIPKLSDLSLSKFKHAFVAGEVHCDRMTVPESIVALVHNVYDEFAPVPRCGTGKRAKLDP